MRHFTEAKFQVKYLGQLVFLRNHQGYVLYASLSKNPDSLFRQHRADSLASQSLLNGYVEDLRPSPDKNYGRRFRQLSQQNPHRLILLVDCYQNDHIILGSRLGEPFFPLLLGVVGELPFLTIKIAVHDSH